MLEQREIYFQRSLVVVSIGRFMAPMGIIKTDRSVDNMPALYPLVKEKMLLWDHPQKPLDWASLIIYVSTDWSVFLDSPVFI